MLKILHLSLAICRHKWQSQRLHFLGVAPKYSNPCSISQTNTLYIYASATDIAAKNSTDIKDKTVHEITTPVRHLSTHNFLEYREAQITVCWQFVESGGGNWADKMKVTSTPNKWMGRKIYWIACWSAGMSFTSVLLCLQSLNLNTRGLRLNLKYWMYRKSVHTCSIVYPRVRSLREFGATPIYV